MVELEWTPTRREDAQAKTGPTARERARDAALEQCRDAHGPLYARGAARGRVRRLRASASARTRGCG